MGTASHGSGRFGGTDERATADVHPRPRCKDRAPQLFGSIIETGSPAEPLADLRYPVSWGMKTTVKFVVSHLPQKREGWALTFVARSTIKNTFATQKHFRLAIADVGSFLESHSLLQRQIPARSAHTDRITPGQLPRIRSFVKDRQPFPV